MTSTLLHCEAHAQTKAAVLERWAQVEPLGREQAIDLTLCHCCTGPAKYPGINAMSLTEIARLTPLCSRCVTKENG